MTTNAYITQLTVQIGDGASPEVFNEVPECVGVDEFGKENELIDATHFGSAGNREYIAGLADGSLITMSFHNRVGNTYIDQFKTDVNNGTTRNFKLLDKDASVSPDVTDTYSFAGVCISWKLGPAIDDKETIDFQVKISGDITES